MDGNYSLADIRSALGGDDGFGAGSWGWLILIFLFFLGFSGNGGLFGRGNDTTDRDVLTTSANTQRDVLNAQAASVAQGYQNQIATLNNQYQTLLGFKDSQYQMQQCCCSLKTEIQEQNQLTRDLINAKTIQDYRDLAQSYQNQLYNTQLANSIVNSLRPYPVPAYAAANPYSASSTSA